MRTTRIRTNCNRTTSFRWTGALAAALVLAVATTAEAQDAKPGLSATDDLAAALRRLGDGREVELVLENGKTYHGKLGGVGDETVLLTRIAGKEFFDVLIDLDAVAAVELRVR